MRYAFYLTPPEGSSLEQAARAWLGRSAFGAPVERAAAPVAASVEGPSRYGFHATLRAPFRPAPGVGEADLLEALDRLGAQIGVLEPHLAIGRLGPFLAFLSHDQRLVRTAEAVVEATERYRAPLSDAERARRKPERLDARGRELLERYGYPYVLERFRFHMTLSGALASGDRAAVERAAAEHFASHDHRTHALRLALFQQQGPERPFTVVATAPP